MNQPALQRADDPAALLKSAKLIDGEVEYNRTVSDDVLSEEEKADGICLSCRAVPVGDVTIALREENLRRVASLLAFFAKA